jgi:hypothetical protein
MRDGLLLRAAIFAVFAFSSSAGAGGDDDDDKAPGPGQQSGLPTLNDEQQRAVGIVVGRPLAAKTPERIEAFGLVLDATLLIADLGEKNAAAAALRSASAELARLRGLVVSGAGGSMRALEAAQTDQARAQAEADSAAARFELRWGPVAALAPAAREQLLAASASGHSLLVRADLPGQHSLGLVPSQALLDVDGIQVPGRVLGALRQSTDTLSPGVLVEVENAPLGLGPGARVPTALLTAQRAGLLLPRDALLYDETGAYVFKRLGRKAGDKDMRYAPVKVSLLLPYGEGWLVDGVDDDDDIVVRGAGVLWSLQGVGAHAVDDDD